MELEALKKSWEQYDKKLDQHLKLNQRIFREMNLNKTRSSLRALLSLRILEASIFLAAEIALAIFSAYHIDSIQFVISAAILQTFAITGLSGSLTQIILIAQIDYATPVTVLQKKLERVKTHMMQITKLMMLSIPFYMAYIVVGFQLFFGIDIVAQGDPKWWIANIILSLLFIPLAVWIYRKLSWKNIHIPWVKQFIYSIGGKQITKAIGFLQEIDNFEKETTIS